MRRHPTSHVLGWFLAAWVVLTAGAWIVAAFDAASPGTRRALANLAVGVFMALVLVTIYLVWGLAAVVATVLVVGSSAWFEHNKERQEHDR